MSVGSTYWNRVKSWASSVPFIGKAMGRGANQIEEMLRLPPPRKPDDVPNTKQYEEHASTAYMDLKMAFRDIGR